ncbi:putative 21.7 KDA protein IN SYRB 5'REGION (ORF4) (plasmid) [Sinorhizobium fredii CCBAU 83666]|nr:putative 21.7 KDA protein IN SYRB 5'REGION (ORF4) [Sinorhizobium fredii CCBAU 83666]
MARRKRPKRARTQVVARSAVATNEAQSVQPSSSADTFFNEVAILDEEIKELRRLLAQKLNLQNVQLKRMLERFNVS